MSFTTVGVLSGCSCEESEPTDAELRAIELQHPVLVAELKLLDAEIAAMDRPGDRDSARHVLSARVAVLTAQLNCIEQLLSAALRLIGDGKRKAA